VAPRARRADLSGPATEVAPRLVGWTLVSRAAEGVVRGTIVETEAYLPEDPASHAFGGPTARNRAMFERPGTLYVYLIYGLHHCCNVVTDRVGVGSAVLLRAAEPTEGIELMRTRRPGVRDRDLCRGPGRLAAAFGIDRRLDGEDLVRGTTVWLERRATAVPIVRSARVGIRVATEHPWRFSLSGSPWVSSPAPAASALGR
jgi:DNA-3-methyladenine glycosylase